jgi:hypothetical protein
MMMRPVPPPTDPSTSDNSGRRAQAAGEAERTRTLAHLRTRPSPASLLSPRVQTQRPPSLLSSAPEPGPTSTAAAERGLPAVFAPDDVLRPVAGASWSEGVDRGKLDKVWRPF